jgi:hypothetical protein
MAAISAMTRGTTTKVKNESLGGKQRNHYEPNIERQNDPSRTDLQNGRERRRRYREEVERDVKRDQRDA